MKAGSLALASAAAFVGLLTVGTALAADFGPPPPPPPPEPIVYVPVNYHCVRWTERCDRRWGLGSPRLYRCMWRHGC